MPVTSRRLPAADFLSVDEAADLLRVDRKTVYQAIAEGTLPHLRVGRLIRIRRADLEGRGVAAAG